MLGCPGLGVSGGCPPLHLLQGSCTAQDKFAAGVVLEGLRQRRVAANIMNDHDVFVAEAGDLWESPHLIGVHCLLRSHVAEWLNGA
jgi:hypothetical protein